MVQGVSTSSQVNYMQVGLSLPQQLAFAKHEQEILTQDVTSLEVVIQGMQEKIGELNGREAVSASLLTESEQREVGLKSQLGELAKKVHAAERSQKLSASQLTEANKRLLEYEGREERFKKQLSESQVCIQTQMSEEAFMDLSDGQQNEQGSLHVLHLQVLRMISQLRGC